jgi:hypothetical protein
MIAIVIGERDIANSPAARCVDPWLQEMLGVTLNAVTLRMRVVISAQPNWSIGVLERCQKPLLHHATAAYGAVMNFCRARSSGYFGKKTSTL